MKYMTKPEYVEAFDIRDVCPPGPDDFSMLYLSEGNTASTRARPCIGDYVVVGQGIYTKEDFERKFQPVLAGDKTA